MMIKIYQDNIVCQPHELEVCTSCNMNWTTQNQLAHSLDKKPDMSGLKAQIQKLKEKGNECFKSNRPREAIDFYTQALECIWSRPLNEPLAFKTSKEELVPILSNRSATYVITKQFVEALVDAEIVLRLRSNWPKGWFRKGKALIGLKRYEEAKRAFQMGLMYEKSNQELLNALSQVDNNRECL